MKRITIGLVLLSLFLSLSHKSLAQSVPNRARQLETQGRYQAALQQYQESLNENPMNYQVNLGILRTATILKKQNPAEEAISRLEEINPGTVETAKWATKFYFRTDQLENAEEWAERFRKRNPESWEPYHFKSQIYQALNDYLQAQEFTDAASIRTSRNQWVVFDQVMIDYFLDGEVSTERIQDLLSLADNPVIHWKLVQTLGEEWSLDRITDVLDSGGSFLPADRPPIVEPVSEEEYRYWWSRMHYESGNRDRAQEVLGDRDGDRNRAWLKVILSGDRPLPRRQSSVLTDFSDYLPYQWQHSRQVRNTRNLGEKIRTRASDFFYQEYENNRFRDYPESAMGALLRSLEMNPVNSERQFELAQFFHDRGWLRTEREVVNRVEELGIVDQQRVTDYREGLGPVDTPVIDPKEPMDLDLVVTLGNPWLGPIRGASTLESMIRHNLFHQPAFRVNETYGNSSPAEASLRMVNKIRADEIDGGIILSVRDWDQQLEVDVSLHYPDGSEHSFVFFDSGRMKVWNLLNQTITSLKEEWPWQGRIKSLKRDGGWINLGRVHGLDSGDTMVVQSSELSEEQKVLMIDESRENQSFLSFPSPYYSTVLYEGTTTRK